MAIATRSVRVQGDSTVITLPPVLLALAELKVGDKAALGYDKNTNKITISAVKGEMK